MVTMAFFHPSQQRLCTLFCVILFSLIWTPLAAAQETPAQSVETQQWMPPEAESLLEELQSLRDQSLAIAPLLDLQSALRWMQKDQAAKTLDRARAIVRDPQAQTWADYMRLRFYLESGEVEKMQDLERDMGFVTQWMLVGPFRNDGMDGFDAIYDPEREGYQGETQEFIGKFNDLQWLPVQQSSETGFIAAYETIGDARSSVLYAIAECYVERSADAVHLSVDGAYKLWIDEQPIAQQENNLGGGVLRDHADVKLRRGWHRVFLKVATDRVDPGWHVRIVNARGQSAIQTCRAPEKATPPVETSEEFPPATTIFDALMAQDTADWTPDQHADAAYIVRMFQREDPDEPWSYFLDNLRTASLSTRHRVRAARAEHTRWRKYQRIADLAPETLPVADALYALDLRGADRALQAKREWTSGLRALQQAHPEDPRPQLQWWGYLASESQNTSVTAPLLNLLQQYGPRPALCRSVFHRVERRDDHVEALYDQCADRALEDMAAVTSYVSRKATRGELTELDALLKRFEPLWSGRIDWLWLQQTVARFQGNEVDALRAIDNEIARRPHEEDGYLRRADALIRLGRQDEAAVALRTAIDLRPQAQNARDLLAFIEVQKDKFYDRWRVDDEKLLALEKEIDSTGYDLGTLVNQQVVNVYRGGLSSKYTQVAYVAATREGAESLRYRGIPFVPGESDVQILAVRVVRPDGTRHESFQTRDHRPYSGPSMMYDDVHERRISISNIRPGDIVNIEYVTHEIGQQNKFDDYFGGVATIDNFHPTALFRYVLYAEEGRELYVERSGERLELPVAHRDGLVERVYEEKNIPAVPREHGRPGFAEVLRYLHVSTYNDTDRLSNWYWNLIKDQMTTSPEMIATVEKLLEGVSDRREQVSKIYNYVVQNTRYVSLAFGIAGWRPHRTTSCFNQRYGDCKDTASLLKVMLGIADIPSHVVLIRTRDLGRMKNHLPSLHIFNHAITYVPEFELYLDGTTSYHGSDELIGADQGASAIIILDGNGGTQVETPFQPAATVHDRLTFDIDARTPDIRGAFTRRLTGAQAASVRSNLGGSDQKREDLERLLAQTVPELHVESSEFEGLYDLDQPVELRADLRGGRWIVERGEEFLVQPFGYKTFDLSEMTSLSQRTQPLSLEPPQRMERTLILRVPQTLRPKRLPKARVISEHPEFGRFTMTVDWDDAAHTLTTHGELVRHVTDVTPENYAAFRAWVREMERRANQPILFEHAPAAEGATP